VCVCVCVCARVCVCVCVLLARGRVSSGVFIQAACMSEFKGIVRCVLQGMLGKASAAIGGWPHPAPYTLHPAPYTLHPTLCTLHSAPYHLHPTPY